jgi:hypothetical protein
MIYLLIICDDYLITYYTCKLNYIAKIKTYYNFNQTIKKRCLRYHLFDHETFTITKCDLIKI